MGKTGVRSERQWSWEDSFSSREWYRDYNLSQRVLPPPLYYSPLITYCQILLKRYERTKIVDLIMEFESM